MIIKDLLLNKRVNNSCAPVWLMRQAGRTLPEYRALRAQTSSFWDMCFNPKFTVEATLQPVQRFDMDAAILFSDILTVPKALGQKIDFKTGVGPLSDTAFVTTSLSYQPDEFLKNLSPIADSIASIRSKLSQDKTLIGFAGGPLTVACYMVEGQKSKTHNPIRAFIYRHPEKFDSLIEVLVQATIDYLSFQIEAGVDVIQLFESWAGILPEKLTWKYVIQPALDIAAAVKKKYPHVPLIIFPRGASSYYDAYVESGLFEGLSLDHQVDFGALIKKYGHKICFQGGIDPAILLAGREAIEREVPPLVGLFSKQRYIANLSHGLDPLISVEAIHALVDTLRKGT